MPRAFQQISFVQREPERPAYAQNVVACPVCGGNAAMPLGFNHQRELYRCRRCRLVHAKIAAEGWKPKEYCQRYYTDHRPPPEFDAITEARCAHILAKCERTHRRGRLFDVGCGSGHLLVAAAARGWSVVGQEVSASELAWLEALKARSGCQFEFVREDLLEAGLAPGSFAAITLVEVLEHLPSPAATLSCCYALLEPGDVLYLTTPNFDSLSRQLLGVTWRGLVPDHICLFNVRSLRIALAQAGFRSRRVVTRNLDVPEILLKLRHARTGSAGQLDTFPPTQNLRRRIESSRVLRGVKRGINAGLRLTRAGDVVEAFAVKPLPS